jgi:selenocysteine-specific elongation factor
MPWIIGTAGHIDHGKTSLIKALTGQDTDRLKEEKERGISIDLGFAHLDLPDGTRAGIVDVPGHERFIRNMLAGAHGIDLVLFTVAADDGIMPQTEEHIDIVHFLRVRRAIFVITKTDLVSEDRVQEVTADIGLLMAGTCLEDSAIVPFSFRTGQGLERLRSQIFETLRSSDKPRPTGYFRLPVDRAFVLPGHGLVVTGTAISGEIAVGDRVRCLPGDQPFHVRSIHVHHEPVETATWGQRIALNLRGPDRASIVRGHVICHEKITQTSDRFDAYVEVRPTATSGLANHQRIRVHVATAERLGRIILLGRHEKAAPRSSAYCQITMSEPVLTLRGDHFIVRDETGQRTLGGGVVIHAFATKHKRRDPKLETALAVLHRADRNALVDAFLGESGEFAVPMTRLHQFLNLTEEELRGWLEQTGMVRVFMFDGATFCAAERQCRRVEEALLDVLRGFHGAHPLAPGMDLEEARAALPGQIPARIFRALIEPLEADRIVVREGHLLRLPGHRIQLGDDGRALVEKICSMLGSNPLAPPDLKDIEKELGVGRARLAEVMRVMEREGSIVRVTSDLFFLNACIDRVKDDLFRHLSHSGDITPGAFRDLFGTTRKYAIPLLEYLDREGVTIRVGGVRRLRPPSVRGRA